MKKNYLTLLLLVLCFVANSQYGPPKFIDVAGSNSSLRQFIKTVDINNDGLKDIVVGSDVNPAIRIYHNTGGLTFTPKTTIPATWQNLLSIDVGDINGDGLPDIISADKYANKLYWHPNTAGTFQVQTLIASGLTFTMGRVLCADFTGDGNNDIISLSHADALLFVNNGMGVFSAGQSLVPPDYQTEFYDIAMGDFNNDNFMDIVLASDAFKVFHNNGTGQFLYSAGIYPGLSRVICAGDFNNDGFDDIAAKSHVLKAYKNVGSTSYTEFPAITPNNQNYKSLFPADVDNDGDLDLITEDDQTSSVFWYENNGTGTFGTQHLVYSNSPLAAGVYGVAADDLDNDGDQDLIWTGGSGQVVVHENLSPLSVDTFTKNEFTLYPNPALGTVFIKNTNNTTINSVRIYNSLRQLVQQNNMIGLEGIALDKLAAGSYFVEITSGHDTTIKQMIIK
jgi:hypothetical protein